MSADWSFETKQIHAGQTPDSQTNARALPIYQTTSYMFDATEHAANLFGLEELGNIYTRIMNPTQAAVEDRVAALEGGVAALLVSQRPGGRDASRCSTSPRPATTSCRARRSTAAPTTCSTTRSPSSASRSRSSTTPTTSSSGAPPSARTPRRSSARPSPTRRTTSSTSRASPRSRTRSACRSSSTTPSRRRTSSARSSGAPTSSCTRPRSTSAATAPRSPASSSTAARFDYAADPERFPNYNQPDPSYHGLVYARDLGVGSALGANLAFILKARVQLLRDLGAAVSPFNAFLIAQGIETLSLRIERHVAERAEGRRVARGARRGRVGQLRRPAVVAVVRARPEVRPEGHRRACSPSRSRAASRRARSSSRRLELHSHVANIGDVRSLVIHPASTTHSQLTAEEQATTGVTPGPRAPVGRHREHRRHPRRPRRRLPRRQGRLSTDASDARVSLPPAVPGGRETPWATGGSPTVGGARPRARRPARRGHRRLRDLGRRSTRDRVQRRPRPARAHRRLPRRRRRRARASHARAGGTGSIGPGAPIDTDRWFVVAPNVLGGCQGTTGPSSLAPDGRPYGSRFPRITVRDQVRGRGRRSPTPSASTAGPRSSAARWAACARSSGRSGHRDRVALALCSSPSGAVATADQIGTQTAQILAITSDPRLARRRLPRRRARATGPTARPRRRPPHRAPDLPQRARARRRASATTPQQGEDPLARRAVRRAVLPRPPGRQARAPLRRRHATSRSPRR